MIEKTNAFLAESMTNDLEEGHVIDDKFELDARDRMTMTRYFRAKLQEVRQLGFVEALEQIRAANK